MDLKQKLADLIAGVQVEGVLEALADYIASTEYQELAYDQAGGSDWDESVAWCKKAAATLRELASTHPEV